MINDSEIESALNYLRDNSTKAAQAKANREYLDEYKKVLKAAIMREHEGLSLGAQEAIAYSDHRYEQHLKAWKDAVEQDVYFQWMRIAAETKVMAWQSMSANERSNRI